METTNLFDSTVINKRVMWTRELPEADLRFWTGGTIIAISEDRKTCTVKSWSFGYVTSDNIPYSNVMIIS